MLFTVSTHNALIFYLLTFIYFTCINYEFISLCKRPFFVGIEEGLAGFQNMSIWIFTPTPLRLHIFYLTPNLRSPIWPKFSADPPTLDPISTLQTQESPPPPHIDKNRNIKHSPFPYVHRPSSPRTLPLRILVPPTRRTNTVITLRYELTRHGV